MLVLTRKSAEGRADQSQSRVWVGDICITLCRVDDGQARIGIEAHPSIPIVREELLDPNDPRRNPQGGPRR